MIDKLITKWWLCGTNEESLRQRTPIWSQWYVNYVITTSFTRVIVQCTTSRFLEKWLDRTLSDGSHAPELPWNIPDCIWHFSFPYLRPLLNVPHIFANTELQQSVESRLREVIKFTELINSLQNWNIKASNNPQPICSSSTFQLSCGAVRMATSYGLDGPGFEPRWGRDFWHQSRPALDPSNFLYNGHLKRPGSLL
jgi:hypothetical protein